MKTFLVNVFYFIVGWWMFTFPAIFFAFAGQWSKVLVMVGCILFLMGMFDVFIFFMDGSKRRPDESWHDFRGRIMRDSTKYSELREEGYGHVYIRLDCGHILYVHNDPSGNPEPGDEAWCHGHGRFSRARLQHVVDANAYIAMSSEDFDSVLI